MIEADDIREAQAMLDRCRCSGAEVYLWRGEINVTGAKPSGQRLAQMRKHEEAIRQLLGDDGRTHPWAVSQLPGGTLLYQHPRLSRAPSPSTHRRQRGKKLTEPRNPAATSIMMPFGQYKGQSLADIL